MLMDLNRNVHDNFKVKKEQVFFSPEKNKFFLSLRRANKEHDKDVELLHKKS